MEFTAQAGSITQEVEFDGGKIEVCGFKEAVVLTGKIGTAGGDGTHFYQELPLEKAQELALALLSQVTLGSAVITLTPVDRSANEPAF